MIRQIDVRNGYSVWQQETGLWAWGARPPGDGVYGGFETEAAARRDAELTIGPGPVCYATGAEADTINQWWK